MIGQKRTYRISIDRTPSISGYGGYDEWTLEDLTPEAADYLIERLDALVRSVCKAAKVEGGFTGVQ